MSTWWDRFNQSWADTGPLDDPTPAQANVGWEYIGQAPPTVEQFNSVHQWWDKKDNWLFGQISTVITKANLVPVEGDLLTLWEAIKFIFEAPNDAYIYARGQLGWHSGGTFSGDITAGIITARGTVNAASHVSAGGNVVATGNVNAATYLISGTDVYVGTVLHIGGGGSPWTMSRGGGYQTSYHSTEWYEQYQESSGNRIWAGNIGGGVITLMQLAGGSLWCATDITANRNLVAAGTVQGGYITSTGNVNAGGTVTASGDINANGSMMVGSGITYVAYNYAYYSGRSSDGAWRWVENNSQNMEMNAGGRLWIKQNLNCSQAIDWRDSSLAGCFGTTPGAAFRFYSDGSGNAFQQLGVQGWGSIMSYNTQIYPTGGGAWSCDIYGQTAQHGNCAAAGYPGLSDATIKTNVHPWTPDLDTILGIETVSFQYREDFIKEKGVTHYGVTAQQVRTVLPEAIVTLKMDTTTKIMTDPNSDEKYEDNGTNAVNILAVDLNVVVYACVNAIKQLSAKVDAALGPNQNPGPLPPIRPNKEA
jgi:hypothetical protein